MDNTIRERLLKIKALSERGSKHEAILAAEKLQELLDKYGLTESDLDEHVTKTYTYKYKLSWHKDLLCQIKTMITGNHAFFNYRNYADKKQRIVGFGFTVAEKIEFEWLYKHYQAEYMKELKLLYVAFIHKHDLFAPATEESSRKLTDKERRDLRKMMSGLSSETMDKDIKQITK